MNFQCSQPTVPLKVYIANPLTPAAQLIATKILSGIVFGKDQRVDLTLLVYSNEIPIAEISKLELEKCAYPCTFRITVSSDMPSVSDADVFCFLTNFPNPNHIDFDKIDTEEHFDTLYLIMKIANNFKWNHQPTPSPEEASVSKSRKINREEIPPKRMKPIFIADGLAAIDILYSFSKDMPNDVFYCPTPLPNIAKSILGDYLKIKCNVINDALVWAADDEVFHVEVEKPYILQDRPREGACEWAAVGQEALGSVGLDHTQFNASWMLKEFIEKIKATAAKNPYGCIYKASEFSKALTKIWLSRSNENEAGEKTYASLGVISDGSIGTSKGYPYVLPLTLSGDTWAVNERFYETSHLKHEVKRINKAAKEYHAKLITYCKKFLQENVIDQAFMHVEEESTLSICSP